ncbi:MAG: hypothetical protein U5J62_06445 [Desulfurivibrio sp.]|nr:hypothetical protein [Desulfurivibrio sp.]
MRDFLRLPELAKFWQWTESELFLYDEQGLWIETIADTCDEEHRYKRQYVRLQPSDLENLALHGEVEVSAFVDQQDQIVYPAEPGHPIAWQPDGPDSQALIERPVREKKLVKRDNLFIRRKVASRFCLRAGLPDPHDSCCMSAPNERLRLPELAKHWGCTEGKLLQWGEEGLLQICTEISKSAFSVRRIPYVGTVILRPTDLGHISLHGQTEVDDFLPLIGPTFDRVRHYEGKLVGLLEEEALRRAQKIPHNLDPIIHTHSVTQWKSVQVKRESLFILREEAERFAAKYPELVGGQSTVHRDEEIAAPDLAVAIDAWHKIAGKPEEEHAAILEQHFKDKAIPLKTTKRIKLVIKWKSPSSIPPDNQSNPGGLDFAEPESPYYAPELHAAWEAYQTLHPKYGTNGWPKSTQKKKSPTAAAVIRDWLEDPANNKRFNRCHWRKDSAGKDELNKSALERISQTANWKKNGPAPTP